ncbi:MAG TPA: NADH:ubiquinone reductase (Na(+)-transporting) subunit A [Planctomycetaceae bacterium]|nr:NADH:ubiquinone reductase (Na(+)-transporting) subunit A [Planctomycetaceae bacterium]
MTSVTRISRGLDLPILGGPEQSISAGPSVRHVALLGDDYIGMKPTMHVAEGDRVKLGQVVFSDKKTPGVQYTAPATGTVRGVNRGAKRKFESLVIEVDAEGENSEQETFTSYPDQNLAQLDRRQVCEQLVSAGLWTAFRTRPYSRVPTLDAVPKAIFVTAIDTNPLAADPAVILAQSPANFIAGLEVLSTLTEGLVNVCRKAGAEIPGEDKTPAKFYAFDGPHPAGLVGTHMHLLEPVCQDKSVWHIGYQDVLAIGHLFITGKILTDRVISLAGPIVTKPRLLRTRLGASIAELTEKEYGLAAGQTARVISGSVLSGRHSVEPVDFLGRYHNQISILAEGGQREFLGWMTPGSEKFSIRRIFSSSWTKSSGDTRRFPFNTSTSGSPRAIIPIGMYEQVMPLDIVATPLLKALVTGDTEYAQQLGVLELDEEDLALCTFVCPGKYEYGPLLRQNLTTIEQEG